jgi:hypothetical protein
MLTGIQKQLVDRPIKTKNSIVLQAVTHSATDQPTEASFQPNRKRSQSHFVQSQCWMKPRLCAIIDLLFRCLTTAARALLEEGNVDFYVITPSRRKEEKSRLDGQFSSEIDCVS